MKLLTKEMQDTIARQIPLKARDIDVCIYGALDGTLPKEYVLDSLMLFRTKDGGFGHGLYIDNYNTNTSVYQIYEAFRILDMVGFDSSNEEELFIDIINKAANILYNRCKMDDLKWDPNVITNNDFAHSKEFEYCEENRKLFGYHPAAALTGYTLKFFKNTKAYYKKALKNAEGLLDRLLTLDQLSKYEFISFNSLIESLDYLGLLKNKVELAKKHLISLAEKQVTTNFKEIDNVLPLDASGYVFNENLKEKIDLQLDYIIESIKSHGLWEKEKSWGYNKYAEEDSAMIKWIGAESVNNYYILKKFGRLE